jgi:BirA family biotin operon repressor/biotin-[acetyl-CoA-carboxylase] ligase
MIIGSKKILIEKLSSTNLYASNMVRKGIVQEGTVIYTNYQTAGRGQAGNSWESQYGKNLLFSIILYPHTVKADDQFIISKAITLGIRDYLFSFTGNISIKWPNDIYVKDDKIAGILIENAIIKNEIEYSIIGIGVNINQERFPAAILNPTSLKILTGTSYKPEDCLNELVKALDIRYKQILNGKIAGIDSDYINSLYRYNEWTEFKDSDGVFEGKIIAVTGSGRLQIEDRRSRIYEFGFREVDFL